MTTAHRPTFESAKGKNSQSSGTILHTRSLPAHTKLKYRQRGQGGLAGLLDQDAAENSGSLTESNEEKRAHLRAQLLQREENYNEKRLTDKRRLPSSGQDGDDNEENGEEAGQLAQKRARLEDLVNTIDADDDSSSSEDEANDDSNGNHPNHTAAVDGSAASDSNSDSESESESDDEDELQRELEKIRQERAEQKAREEARERERELEAREKEIAFGNPLLNKTNAINGKNNSGSSSSRRKWNDDVVFKNQAKGVDDKKDNGFINDMIRSDFHRKFMNKYIK
ncbi:hypothetical protein D0Z00_001361 [Geotrichum galactomycetum]|uniref:Uncharacterized protein n=1 Tax=Geotrichum galactomycetum TaxID=27317 RepID=A0ACB6V7E9_9ASCO|nr:hypothetical protein D0Z00_001361 [Geotrichum candidum]